MSNIRALNSDEIAQVSGGGNSGDHEHNFDRSSNNGYSGGIGYGAQANGRLGNTAAKNQGLGQGDCSNGVAGGLIGGLSSGNALGFAGNLIGGAIAGGCFKGSDNGNSSNRGGSNCSDGGFGGTCNR
ncbi:hypothetical protein [Kosakonia sp. R1.Fl]|uniref:hypothetical protein n=1 Tax=Kosakonia sp. R1.Fl TaxID=2928706 RepID=UPI00201D8F00|nr:hypothetical protein [Kosakonia sp. R1.Fl]MCL6746938.1 hypothetical protein [Kosakonia sp. R1.Fl]